MRRRRGQRSLEATRDNHLTYLMGKKTSIYMRKCSLFDCSNTITFTVGNVNVFEGPLTLASDGFVYFPLFFYHFGEHIQVPTYSPPCLRSYEEGTPFEFAGGINHFPYGTHEERRNGPLCLV